ncbi:hypothetical protein CP533_2882 [Ophiocordyceps camponoti-saundersi (nom. inval.)]|nr:hypothetical protein CP533_2882 [Ophiocordyceps camponoti-saundersi (nom. inval.)]
MAPNASSMFPFSQTEPSTDLVNGSSWGTHGEGPQNYQDFPDNGSSHSGDAEEYLFTSGQSTPRGARTDQPQAADTIWTATRTVSSGAPRTHAMSRVNSSRSSSSLSPSHLQQANLENATTMRNGPQPTGSMSGIDSYLMLDSDATVVPQAYWPDYSFDMTLSAETNGMYPLASAGPLHVVPSHMHLGTEPGMLDNSSPSSWDCFSSSISRTSSPATIDDTWLSAPMSPHSSPDLKCQSSSAERKMAIKSEDGNGPCIAHLDDPLSLSQTLVARRQGSDGESARDHVLYKNAAPRADGLFHCPWEGQANCNHKPEKLKCNYDKFVDSHLKPYRCKAESCEGARFSSTACLLRHEREAHGLHGHGDKPFLCVYEGCERAVTGNGFPRQWNLRDHMKRVHNDHGSAGGSPPSAAAVQPSKGRKRKTDIPEPQTTTTTTTTPSTSRKASVKTAPVAEPVQPSSKPLLEQWLDHRHVVEDMVRGLNKPDDSRSLQQITEVQKRLSVMAKMTTELSAMPKAEIFPTPSRRSYYSIIICQEAAPLDSDSVFKMARKFFVGGNFKMNGSISTIKEIVNNLNKAVIDAEVEIVVAPPALYLLLLRENLRSGIEVAAQNVYDKPNGAYTGEISVSQLKDSNITWTILGHSERRTILKETDEVVASRTKYATENGLGVIWCCGESLEQREAGKTIEVVSKQLEALKAQVSDWSRIVIAYEPIWAIGTGKVATTEQAQEVHKAIRAWLKGVSPKVADETRILYGGSVNEKNCGELSKQPDIDGFLVGGASLKPAFIDIINCRKQ